MDRSAWRRLSRHLVAHATFYVFLLVLVATVTVTARFPVYFRADDIHYLNWSAAHANPLSAFGLSESAHDGTFRPLNLLVWWLCYQVFGLNAVGYQLTIGLAYGMSFVFLFKLVELVFSRRAAVFSLLAYIAIFSKLTFIIFWFSDMTIALEVLLINLSLYLLASAVVRTDRWLPWGVLAYLAASLSKEPATLIVPAVATVFLASTWSTIPGRRRRKLAAVFLTVLLIGISWTIGAPSLRRRQVLSLSMGLPAIAAFLMSRLRFYGAELRSGGGVLVWVASFHLVLVGWAKRRCIASRIWYYLCLALAAAGALLVTRAPAWGLVLLCLSLALILAKRAPAAVVAVWAALPLIGILTVGMMVRAYLVEASFGLAALVGVAAAECSERLVADLRRLRPVLSRAVWAVLLALFCAAAFTQGPAFRSRLHALSIVSVVRQNFRDAVLFTRDHLDVEGHNLVVVDYDELGIHYPRDVRNATDIDKVRRQKTMSSWEVQMLLRLHGAEHVDVHVLQWFRDGGDEQVFFMAMNRGERDYILALGLDLDLLYEVKRRGEGAWIYHLVERNAMDAMREET